MKLLIAKYLVTALVIVLVSEIAKRSDKTGALVASLPIVTIMVMIWLHLEGQGAQKIANHAFYTFWYVIPTLPMFLVMPWLMSKPVDFWFSLVLCAVTTLACFVLVAAVAGRFGLKLIP